MENLQVFMCPNSNVNGIVQIQARQIVAQSRFQAILSLSLSLPILSDPLLLFEHSNILTWFLPLDNDMAILRSIFILFLLLL